MGIPSKRRDYFLPVYVWCKGNENRPIEEWFTERQRIWINGDEGEELTQVSPGYKEKFVLTGARISKMLITCHHESNALFLEHCL